MIGGLLAVAAALALLIYFILSWWSNRQNIKAADKGVMAKVLKELRMKKKATEKITMIEFLNQSPKLVGKIINNMLELDVVRVDKDGITISEFGKHYYDKFLKRK